VDAGLAQLYIDQKKWKEAEPPAREAVALAEQRMKSDPKNRETAFDASEAYAAEGAALQADLVLGDAHFLAEALAQRVVQARAEPLARLWRPQHNHELLVQRVDRLDAGTLG